VIKYKGLVCDSKDHPDGVAILIVAPSCTYGCKKCINQHLKKGKYHIISCTDLINKIKRVSVGNCIVLGGLEWTEDKENLLSILDVLTKENMNIILYTHWDEVELKKLAPEIYKYDIWVKYGKYDINYKSDNYISNGVQLATTNQYIKRESLIK
jgi:hypothetical protein